MENLIGSQDVTSWCLAKQEWRAKREPQIAERQSAIFFCKRDAVEFY